ncbi:CHAP domain-containing protein [Methylomonas sp. MO1]|uniref:CHAP domain-containing protein n=1 Tax=unclassified Methylomonas TaxID=2608980 RepID=UPI000362F729|nr:MULTISPECIES: CHAP domain-containing protein [unclassified Methylomonas]MDT4291838.1 CHAP domain-containing protein [Methylomonas sp. MO1]
MNENVAKLIAIAENEVGTREGATNNTGARIVEYQGATWLAPGAWPWCAAFTAWIMREWLEDERVREALNLPSFSLADKWRCKDASAFGWEKWAKQKNLLVLPETEKAKAGDFVIFDFSHIALVVKDQTTVKEKLITIEGNTNGKGDRDSETGDGVWRKERQPSLTKSYVRIIPV